MASWTPEQVEARLIEWAATLKKLPDRELGWLYGSGTFWPEIMREWQEVWVNALEKEGRHEAMEEPYVPATVDEIRRYRETSEWFLILPDVEDRRLVSAVAVWRMRHSYIGWKFVKRVARLGAHRTTLDRRYKNALEWIALYLVCRDGAKNNA